MPDALRAANLYFNRELSWLEFNARVLNEAFDERNPLLERLKFISIFSTNLDEFYMVRVAGLRRQLAAGVTVTAPDGLSPAEQLDRIDKRVRELLLLQRDCLHKLLLPQLADHGVRLVSMQDLTASEWAQVDAFFEAEVFPVLTPLAVAPGHPFPYISNLSQSLAVEVRDPVSGVGHFARVKVPKSLPRWVSFGRKNEFIALEQVIGSNLGALFPGMDILSWYTFRITRNSDIDVAIEEEPEDLLASIEEQVFLRRFGEVVRLEVQDGLPESIRHLLLDELRDERLPRNATLAEGDIQEVGTLLELGDLMELAQLDIPELRDPLFAPLTPPVLRESRQPIFDAIRDRDMLLHHPFHSFTTTVEDFLLTAAEDDRVLAIKLTLYRTSGDTEIVRALTEAAERGKQVVVLIELKARFDETNNITWARALESVGVHVVYGMVSLKTHVKTALVVRREPDGIRRYVHMGSGNYNSKTARIYTDFGLLTCNPLIGADVSDLFNVLTGFSRQHMYRKLLVAPDSMRERFIALIDRETELAKLGRPARIIVKMNSLADADTIRALYRASQAGVEIDMIVRGICCLRPGLPGVSERIRVISVVGRFLEHSRLWYFANGGAEEFYIGSTDWMPRNFDRRVEAVTPVEDSLLHPLLKSLLQGYLSDNRQAWDLDSEGAYAQRDRGNQPELSIQRICTTDPWGRSPQADGTIAIERATRSPQEMLALE